MITLANPLLSASSGDISLRDYTKPMSTTRTAVKALVLQLFLLSNTILPFWVIWVNHQASPSRVPDAVSMFWPAVPMCIAFGLGSNLAKRLGFIMGLGFCGSLGVILGVLGALLEGKFPGSGMGLMLSAILAPIAVTSAHIVFRHYVPSLSYLSVTWHLLLFYICWSVAEYGMKISSVESWTYQAFTPWAWVVMAGSGLLVHAVTTHHHFVLEDAFRHRISKDYEWFLAWSINLLYLWSPVVFIELILSGIKHSLIYLKGVIENGRS